jgi:superfamily II DNA or RNA helicase
VILRPYQQSDLNGIRAQFASGNRRALHVLPTGGGKTVEIAAMVALAKGRQTRTVILVHRDALLTQASNKLTDVGVKHGIIAPGHSYYGDAVHVASIQTLVRRLDRTEYEFDFIIVDEAHHAVAPTYKKIFDRYPDARILGVTATPVLASGRGLDSVFQVMHLGPSIAALIKDGFLAEPDTYGPKKKLDLSGIRTRMGDYDQHQLAEHMDAPRIVGDAVEHYSQICAGKPAIAFCVNIKHAEDAAAAFQAAGFRSQVVHGKMPLAQVRARISGLADGTIQVLTSCDIVSEGTDVPAVVCAIGLRPTQSLGLHIQQAGRALRPIYAPGFDLSTRAGRLAAIAAGPKPKAIILDHAANCFRHLTVDEPREWSLEGRKKRAKKGGPTISLTQCPKCLRPHKPAPKCPHCGHVYVAAPRDPNTVDGTLEKVDKAALRRAKWGEQRACKTLDELVALGVSRKYQWPRQWAERMWGYMHPRKTTEDEFFA